MNGWDPSKGGNPGDPDHGPYELLGAAQLGIASTSNPLSFTVYSYVLDGNHLTISWLRNDPNGPDANDTTGPFSTIRLVRQ
jgi:hypothetical protein